MDYVCWRDPSELKKVVKVLPPHGKTMIDFMSRDVPGPFEGVESKMDYSCVDDHCELRLVGGDVRIYVPKRSLLLLFKMKAARDRDFRLVHNTSYEPEWERSKLTKDRADILALLDPKAGGEEVDVSFLGDMIEQYGFLARTLDEIKSDVGAMDLYGRMRGREVNELIDRVLLLIR